MQSLKELYRIGCGPSSSHTMGPENAGIQFLKKYPSCDHYKVILYGSLALTGKGHLTDEILYQVFHNKQLEVLFDPITEVPHPNTLDIFGYQNEIEYKIRFFSIGGGEIIEEFEDRKEKPSIYPFQNFKEAKEVFLASNYQDFGDFLLSYEPEIDKYLLQVYQVMKESVERGLKRTGYLPGSLHVKRKAIDLTIPLQTESLEMKHHRELCSYAYAVSEENASGGRIVTAPTCGACGVLPAVLTFYEKTYSCNEKDIIKALAVAGFIGNLFKENACISGAMAGCQAEIGTACSMASAAASYLSHMTIDQIEYSAEISIEHHLGLTCDPIEGYVQIPCIERNAVAALRSIDSIQLAYYLTGSRKISLDLVIETMYETGKDLKQSYRETSSGGLAKHYEKACES